MKLLLALLLSSLTFTVMAQTLDIEARFTISTEYDNGELEDSVVKKEGWPIKTTEDETVYTMKLKVPFAKLPIKKNLGFSSFSIDKTGRVELGASFGDSDAVSITNLFLPMLAGKIAILPAPITVTNSGGDYASGSWSFNGKLVIQTLK